MIKLWKTCLVAGACLALFGCATVVPLKRDQVGAITRDAQPSDLDRTLAPATVLAQFEFEANRKSYLARHYNLLTGSRQEMTMVCAPTCFPVFYTVPIASPYVVVQRLPSKAVHAWGTLEELSKDADPEVSGMMPIVKTRFEEELKKKK